MYKNCTNAQIVDYAIRGMSARTTSGAFKTYESPRSSDLPSRFYDSWNTARMCDNLHALHRQERIQQTIESYATTLAFMVDGQWLIIDDSYSITTNGKHMTHLYRLPNKHYIPRDASLEEIDRILNGHMIYTPGHGKLGTYRAA